MTSCLICNMTVNNPSTGYSGSVGYSPKGGQLFKPHVNAGAIAGGVVGGLAVVAIAVVMLSWIRRIYPKVRHVETEAVSAPPRYDMIGSNVCSVAQPVYVSAGEQPAYVYKSQGLNAKEGSEQVAHEKHVKRTCR
jgi:hypothetical protein